MARGSRTADDAPRVCVTEVPLLYETGGDARFDKVVVITAPTKLRRMRSEVARRGARGAAPARSGEGRACGLLVQEYGSLEELDAFVDSVMRELTAVRRRPRGCSACSPRSPGAFLYVTRRRRRGTSGFAIRCATPVRARARARARPRPGSRRCGHLPGVEVRPERQVVVRRDRSHAADAGDGARHRHAHRRQRVSHAATSTTPRSTSATARGTSTTCSRSTAASGSCSPPTTPARGTSTGGVPTGERIQFAETRAYVKRVEHLKSIYRRAWRTELGTRCRSLDWRRDRTARARGEREHVHAARADATSGIVTTATCSGWGAATSPAGTSRSGSAFAPDEVEEVRAEIHDASARERADRLLVGGRNARDPRRSRRPAARTRAGRRRPTPLAVGMVLTEPPAQAPPERRGAAGDDRRGAACRRADRRDRLRHARAGWPPAEETTTRQHRLHRATSTASRWPARRHRSASMA